jgi:8-oxo-dGTP pyrophosphatase MutT (NUDIX family)
VRRRAARPDRWHSERVLTEESVRAALAGFDRTTADRPDLRAAAVAITLVTTGGGSDGGTGGGSDGGTVQVLLTRRAPKLRTHAGQWALPGGRVDAGESVVTAARRELAEELGLELPESAVLGRLDDYSTRSGFVISPVVLWAGPVHAGGTDRPGDRALHPRRGEVAAVYGIPLDQLDVEPIFVSIPESDAPVIRLPLMGRFVHAPTGAVLYQFRELALHGRATRVGHLEQPVFAWR